MGTRRSPEPARGESERAAGAPDQGEPQSLVEAALRDAKLADAQAERDFWTTSLGTFARRQRAYVNYASRVPVNQRVVFYETMTGDRMNDNPLAIFEYLRSHPEYGSFLHVWSVGKHGSIPEQYAGLDDVVFVSRDTRSYAYFLASAGHLICNATLPSFLARREGQRYLNTWHGIPYKALGRSIADATFGAPSGSSTFLKATHVVTPCEFMTEALLFDYSMTGTSTAQIAETGYPRVDLTLNASADQISRLRQRLGIEEGNGAPFARPVVLYAPTWRQRDGSDAVDVDQLMSDLRTLAALDIQVVYRGHHRIGRLVADHDLGSQVGRVIVPPQDVNSNELLAAVDILITDYSSIFFDFLPTGRPIVHYLYDVDEYSEQRGLNLTVDELPGAVVSSVAELASEVSRASAALRGLDVGVDLARHPLQGERYRQAQHRFAPHEDGASSRRAVEFFFNGETSDMSVRTGRDNRPTVAFWAGTLDASSASAAFLHEVVVAAESPENQVTLVIDDDSHTDADTLAALKALGARVSLVAYNNSRPTLLAAEKLPYTAFIDANGQRFDVVCKEVCESPLLHRVFEREYRRRLDDAHFDNVILGPGLSRHELALAAFAYSAKRSPATLTHAPGKWPYPVRRAAEMLLPRGSARRGRIEETYRAMRQRSTK